MSYGKIILQNYFVRYASLLTPHNPIATTIPCHCRKKIPSPGYLFLHIQLPDCRLAQIYYNIIKYICFLSLSIPGFEDQRNSVSLKIMCRTANSTYFVTPTKNYICIYLSISIQLQRIGVGIQLRSVDANSITLSLSLHLWI